MARVIVIGAGCAGLAAARELIRLGHQVIVLEARTRIGGRVHTAHPLVPVPAGSALSSRFPSSSGSSTASGSFGRERFPVDLGATWLHGLKFWNPLYKIATCDLKMEFVPTSCDDMPGFDVVCFDEISGGRVSVNEYAEVREFYIQIKQCMDQLKQEFDSQPAQDRVELSLAAGFRLGYERALANRLNAGKPALSELQYRVLLWFFSRIEFSLGGRLDSTSFYRYWSEDDDGADLEGLPTTGGLSDIMKHLALGLDIRTATRVCSIQVDDQIPLRTFSWSQKQKKNKNKNEKHDVNNQDYNTGAAHKRIRVETSKGVFEGDFVVCTLPLGVLKHDDVQFDPPLPAWKREAIDCFPNALLDVIVLRFPFSFWPQEANCIAICQDRPLSFQQLSSTATLASFPYQESVQQQGKEQKETKKNNISTRKDQEQAPQTFPPFGFSFVNLMKTRADNAPLLMLQLAGPFAHRVAQMSTKALSEYLIQQVLQPAFPDVEIPAPVGCYRSQWGNYPVSRGAYSAPAEPDLVDAISRPVNNSIFFAGEYGCCNTTGTLQAAYWAGEREARNLHAIWCEIPDNIIVPSAQRFDTTRDYRDTGNVHHHDPHYHHHRSRL